MTRKRRHRAKIVLSRLAARFPDAIRRPGMPRRPLAVGIDRDLVAATPRTLTADLRHIDEAPVPMHVQAVKDALALYTSTRAYRQALAHGGFRVTMDGTVSEPVTARVQDAAIAALRDDGTRLPPGAVRRMRQARRASTIARRGRREGTLTLGSLFET